MDTDLLKTFIEVARTCHFGKAAANLYVTQSAVSARIRLLEQEVGYPLFSRTRNNIQLTSHGEKLISHAKEVLKAWDNACSSLAIEKEFRPSFSIGGVSGLWENNLLPLPGRLYQILAGFDLLVEVETHDTLIKKLHERRLDICFSYDFLPLSKIVSRKVAEIELVMLALNGDTDLSESLSMDHIMVDWGRGLALEYDKTGVSLPRPILRTNSAQLALDFFLRNGGTVFLPKSYIARLLEENRVFVVNGSAQYICPVYAHFFSAGEKEETVEKVLQLYKNNHLTTAAAATACS